MPTPLPIAQPIADAAAHGSWCPKMCTFACPVATSTGRDDAVPWSFHREVADLAMGRADAADIGGRLDLCNGCLACQSACTYEQDVPTQVVAGRSAVIQAGHMGPVTRAAVEAVGKGESPFGSAAPRQPPSDPAATTVIMVGCRELESSLRSLERIARQAKQQIRFVQPEGCCGGVLRSLGAQAAADDARKRLAALVVQAQTIVAMDTTCLAQMPKALDVVTWMYRLHGSGDLRIDGSVGEVTWHDPPTMVRALGNDHAPRALLRAAGARIVEPEGHGRHTVSAGPGLGMELLAPEVADELARRRVAQLRETGLPVVTVGAPDLLALRSAGLDALDLLEVVADNLEQ